MAQAAQQTAINLIRTETSQLRDIYNEVVVFDHALAELAELTDEHLARIIQRAAKAGPQFYNFSVVEPDESGGYGKWVQGLLAEPGKSVDGHEVLEHIKAGRLWLQVERLHEMAPDLYRLVRAAYDEFKARVKHFTYFDLYTNLLISGPRAKVTPHIDVAEVLLFHIRGHKKFTLWDPAKFPVPDEWRESIILREQLEDVPLKPEWLNQGMEAVLGPGEGVSFPFMWPHAVENLGELNVSLQSEYHHPASLRRYAAHYANGIMRRYMGLKPRGTGPGVLGEGLRAMAGAMAKKLKVHSPKPRRVPMQFVFSPAEADGLRWIPEDRQIMLNK